MKDALRLILGQRSLHLVYDLFGGGFIFHERPFHGVNRDPGCPLVTFSISIVISRVRVEALNLLPFSISLSSWMAISIFRNTFGVPLSTWSKEKFRVRSAQSERT